MSRSISAARANSGRVQDAGKSRHSARFQPADRSRSTGPSASARRRRRAGSIAAASGARPRASPRARPGTRRRTPRRSAAATALRSARRRAGRRRLRPGAPAAGPRRSRGWCRSAPLRGCGAPLRAPSAPPAPASSSARAFSSSCRSRSFSSPAAFSVKVTATSPPISQRPVASTRTIRLTSAVVLPVPAAASTTSVSSSADSISVAIERDPSTAGHGRLLSQMQVGHVRLRLARRRAAPPRGRRPGGSRTSVHAPSAGTGASVPCSTARSMASSASIASALRRRVEQHRPLLEAAGRGAEEQPRLPHRRAQHRLGDRRVDERLQHAAAADHQRVLRAVLPGLVIGDPQHLRLAVHVDDVDGAAQREPPVDQHRLRIGCADRGPASSGRPNDSSKYRGSHAPRRPPRAAASRAGRARSPPSPPSTRDRSRAPAARDTRRRRAR